MTFSQIMKNLCLTIVLTTTIHTRIFGETIRYMDISRYIDLDHPLLQPELKDLRKSEVNKNYLKQSFLPKVELHGGYESFSSPALADDISPFLTIEARINLYRGGQDKYQAEIYELEKDLANLSFAEARHHLIIQANHVYWSIAANLEHQRILEETKNRLDNFHADIRQKVASGVMMPSELLAWQIRSDELKYLAIQSEGKNSRDKAHLAYLLGMRKGDSKSISIEYKEDWANFIQHQGQQDHDENFRLNSLLKLAEKTDIEARSLRQALSPVVDFYGSYGQLPYQSREFIDPSDRRETIFGLRVTIPLLNWYINQPLLEANRYHMASLNSQTHIERKKNEAMSARIQSEIDQNQRLLQHASRINESQKKLYRQLVDEYQRGVRSTLDVIDLVDKMYEREQEIVLLKKRMLVLNDCLKHIEAADLCM